MANRHHYMYQRHWEELWGHIIEKEQVSLEDIYNWVTFQELIPIFITGMSPLSKWNSQFIYFRTITSSQEKYLLNMIIKCTSDTAYESYIAETGSTEECHQPMEDLKATQWPAWHVFQQEIWRHPSKVLKDQGDPDVLIPTEISQGHAILSKTSGRKIYPTPGIWPFPHSGDINKWHQKHCSLQDYHIPKVKYLRILWILLQTKLLISGPLHPPKMK